MIATWIAMWYNIWILQNARQYYKKIDPVTQLFGLPLQNVNEKQPDTNPELEEVTEVPQRKISDTSKS